MKHEDRRKTQTASARSRRGNIYDRLEAARAERAKVLETPRPANNAGPASDYAPSVVKIKVRETPAKVTPKRPTKVAANPVRVRKSRRDLLPDLEPVDGPSVPMPTRTIVPRRMSKSAVVKTKPASFAAPAALDPAEEDAELRAAIAAAFRSAPEEEQPVARPRRGRRYLLFACLIVGLAATLFAWTTTETVPPQISDTLPGTFLAPELGSLDGVSVASTARDALPSRAPTVGLPGVVTPEPYRLTSQPSGPAFLSTSPVLAEVDILVASGTPALDTRVLRGTATRLPALASN